MTSVKPPTKIKATKGQAVVGRRTEIEQLEKAIQLGRNVLIEGPVGVGKTFLVSEVLRGLGKGFERVDGDSRYTEQKLTGWFDPPQVMKKGYVAACFIPGPLMVAMKEGKPLFINELNRMPEAVQNILLPAMDEKRITLPKLGEVEAKPGFVVIATQNPREFTATHALSEALMDRFEMIRLHYQGRDEELEILKKLSNGKGQSPAVARALDLVRATRNHPAIKRGASLRAAMAVCELHFGGIDFETSCLMALPSRIEVVSSDEDPEDLIRRLLQNEELPLEQKKK